MAADWWRAVQSLNISQRMAVPSMRNPRLAGSSHEHVSTEERLFIVINTVFDTARIGFMRVSPWRGPL